MLAVHRTASVLAATMRRCGPCTGPPCSDDCGYTGTRKRSKLCWSVALTTAEVIEGTQATVNCPDEVCDKPCTTRSANRTCEITIGNITTDKYMAQTTSNLSMIKYVDV